MPLDAAPLTSGETTDNSITAPLDAGTLHRGLIDLNRRRMSPALDPAGWLDGLESELVWRKREHGFVEAERDAVRAEASAAPREPEAFVAWFEALRVNGPGQGDALFPWLAEHASLEQLRWFLRQEMAGEAGFDDLLALTQLKLPTAAKLELARNYWDEMGQGTAGGMHGPMLERLGRALGLGCATDSAGAGSGIVWESLALANLMCALAVNRHYAYQSIGALGVIELTAPGRSAKVNEALKRLGLTGEARRYYALHATLDVKHSQAWNREVLANLVALDPNTAPRIAEGALLRLNAGARCFARYRHELWGLPAALSGDASSA